MFNLVLIRSPPHRAAQCDKKRHLKTSLLICDNICAIEGISDIDPS
jgi:hypothetical protein